MDAFAKEEKSKWSRPNPLIGVKWLLLALTMVFLVFYMIFELLYVNLTETMVLIADFLCKVFLWSASGAPWGSIKTNQNN